MTLRAFSLPRRSFRRAAALILATAIFGTAALCASGDAAAQNADSKRGSFAERVGSALRNQASSADRSKKPTASNAARNRAAAPPARAVPSPRPLPSQR
ncbi:MAG: hypothetical protein IJE77_09130, partial [Thermoguttaceae bacterium]|nr:hypothetical protein [Thermoguttaceae bacterium]